MQASEALKFGTATLHERCDAPNMLDPALRAGALKLVNRQ